MDILATSSLDMIDLFVLHAGAVRAPAQVVATPAEAAAAIAPLVEGPLKYTEAVRARYPELLAALAAGGVPAQVVEEIAAGQPGRTEVGRALDGGTGLVLAAAGVAETGSLLLADTALAARLASMLVDICIVLLPAAAILPNLDAAGQLLTRLEAEGQRYLSFVTGPSRTADIEMSLTVGVHGPRALHIVVMRDA